MPVAFVARRPGTHVDAAALLSHCREHGVDPIALPVTVHVVEAVPVTAIGKVDKVRLRAIAASSTHEEPAP